MRKNFGNKSLFIQVNERFNLEKEENIIKTEKRLNTLPQKEEKYDIEIKLKDIKEANEEYYYYAETDSFLKDKKVKLEKRMEGLVEKYKAMGNKRIYDIIKEESLQKKLNAYRKIN